MSNSLDYLNSLQLELLRDEEPRVWVVAQYEYLPTDYDYSDTVHYYDEYSAETYSTLEELIENLKESWGESPTVGDVSFDWGFIQSFEEIPVEIRSGSLRQIPVIKTHIIKKDAVFLTLEECQSHILNSNDYNVTAHPYSMILPEDSKLKKLIELVKLGELTCK